MIRHLEVNGPVSFHSNFFLFYFHRNNSCTEILERDSCRTVHLFHIRANPLFKEMDGIVCRTEGRKERVTHRGYIKVIAVWVYGEQSIIEVYIV